MDHDSNPPTPSAFMDCLIEIKIDELKFPLVATLFECVKQCQLRFGSRTELATESDPCVAALCAQLEVLLCHGLKRHSTGNSTRMAVTAGLRHMTEKVTGLNFSKEEEETGTAFLSLVSSLLTRHEYERYQSLHRVKTDLGRCRAWLRATINEHSLERYILTLLEDETLLRERYDEFAALRHKEQSSVLPSLVKVLNSVLFAIGIDNESLDLPLALRCPPTSPKPQEITVRFLLDLCAPSPPYHDPLPVIASTPDCERQPPRRKKTKRKKIAKNFVSLDEEADFAPSSVTSASKFFGLSAENDSGSSCSGSSPGSGLVLNEASRIPVVDAATGSGFEAGVGRKVDNSVFYCDELVRRELVFDRAVETVSDVLTPVSDVPSGTRRGLSNLQPVSRHSLDECFDSDDDVALDLITGGFEPDYIVAEDSISQTGTFKFCSDSAITEVESAIAALGIVQQATLESSCSIGNDSCTAKDEPATEKRPEKKTDRFSELPIVLACKNPECERVVRTLQDRLEHEVEVSESLSFKTKELSAKHEARLEKVQTKLQTMARENELLKHQLKKYVGAVQLLQRSRCTCTEQATAENGGQDNKLVKGDGYNADFGGIFCQKQANLIKGKTDYHKEATQYEQKLIQVAEMHGELIEFNDRLQRVLVQKESLVRRLTEELVDLRGPLPDDGHLQSDDDISILTTSDYDLSSNNASGLRGLINVWIPSAFLSGKSSDTHHVYQVYIRIKDEEWNVYRRYSQFLSLHRELKKGDTVVCSFDFPPKKAIGNKDTKFVEERRRRLQSYLRLVVRLLTQTHSELAFSVDKESLVNFVPFFSDSLMPANRASRGRLGPTLQTASPQLYQGL